MEDAISDIVKQYSQLPDIFEDMQNKEYYQPTKPIYQEKSTPHFPEEVADYVIDQTRAIKFGFIESIKFYFGFSLGRVFLWDLSGRFFKSDESSNVVGVCVSKPNTSFFIDSVDYVLTIATEHYIKVIPISNNTIPFDVHYVITTDFEPVCVESSGETVFIGGLNGHIYTVDLVKRGIVDISSSLLLFLGRFVTFTSIKQLVFEESEKILCVLFANGSVAFYRYNNNRLFVLSIFPVTQEQIVCISPIPVSDSCNVRFIGFSETGTRYFFGHSSDCLSWCISLLYSKAPPVEMTGQKCLFGVASLNYSAILTSNSVITMTVEHEQEYVTYEQIKGVPLCLHISKHSFNYVKSNVFMDPRLWQTIIPAPELHVLTTEASFTIKFSEIYMQLSGAIMKNEKYPTELTDSLVPSTLLLAIKYPYQSAALCSLAYQMSIAKGVPIVDTFLNHVAHICSLFMDKEVFNSKFEVSEVFKDEKPSTLLSDALRLALYFEDNFILTRKNYIEQYMIPLISKLKGYENKTIEIICCIDPIYFRQYFVDSVRVITSDKTSPEANKLKALANLEMSESIKDQALPLLRAIDGAEDLIDATLISKYDKSTLYEYSQKILTVTEGDKSTLRSVSHALTYISSSLVLSNLITTVQGIIEKLKYMKIISSQNTEYIAKAVKRIKKDDKKFDLTGLTINSPSFITKINTLNASFFRILEPTRETEILASQIQSECPTLFSISASRAAQAINSLAIATFLSKAEGKHFVDEAVSIIIEFIGSDLFDFVEIINELISIGAVEEAIRIATERISAIDPYHHALYWFKNGCHEQDTVGFSIFTKVRELSLPLISSGLAMETNNELIHLISFEGISNEEDLIKIQSPFLLEYITMYHKEILWVYYESRSEYGKAIDTINEYMNSNKSLTNDEKKELQTQIGRLQSKK